MGTDRFRHDVRWLGLAFSADGRTLAALESGRDVLRLETATVQERMRFSGHFSPAKGA